MAACLPSSQKNEPGGVEVPGSPEFSTAIRRQDLRRW